MSDLSDRPVVMRIVFEGNQLFGQSSLESRMRTKVGRRYDPNAFDADMAELYRFFQNIQVFSRRVPGGVVLRFVVSENPLVTHLRLRGVAEMEESEIRELIRTRQGYPLSRFQLSQDRRDIVEAYRQRGFHFAHVPEPVVTRSSAGGRQVTLTVVEGPKVEVSRVLFRGNSHLPRKDLLAVMRTSEPDFLERITSSTFFNEATLRQDLVALKQLYRDRGFLDAEVALEEMRFSDDKEEVQVTIAIREHQLYRVGNIIIEIERQPGGSVGGPSTDDVAYFTQDRIRSWVGLKSGGPYSGKVLDEGIKRIREEYGKRSFMDANVSPPRYQGRPRAQVVDVTIKILEGAKYRLARVDVVGNEFTRDKILRRDVRTAPGGYVDANELERGLRRIQRTRFFDRATLRLDDAVGPDGELLPGYKTATYEVQEGKTGKASFGVQLATNGGFGGTIQFRKRNFDITRFPRSWADVESGRAFTGAGQEFNIFLAPSTQESAFSVGFREPRLFGSEWSFDLAAYRRFGFRESYITDRWGYVVGLGYPVYRTNDDTSVLTAGMSWRHEWVDIGDIGSGAVPGAYLFRREHELRALSAQLRWFRTNDIRNTVWESTTNARFESAGGFLGGDLDFRKAEFSHRHMHVVHEDEEGRKHRITGRTSVQWGEAFGDTPELPPYERYYAGGRNFRGFSFRGVGPHINGRPTGGEWAWISSLEYEYPIVAKRFSGVVFTDFGTLGTTLHDDDAHDWRLSVGFGLRIAIPMLGERPLALDFGFPLLYEDEDERSLVSFSMGREF